MFGDTLYEQHWLHRNDI